jgi:hypothetical protein
MRTAPDMNTLLFCTAYADSPQRWESRYRKWLDFFSRGPVARDQILMIDDGSASLPAWRGLRVLQDLPEARPAEKTVLYHFTQNLGRSATLVYPGWFRSFAFAATYARKYGFTKIVHVESDCFLYSERMVRFVNGLSCGWTTFWCESQGFPETCIQVICADQFDAYLKLSTIDYAAQLANRAIETLLPFTDVCKDFVGDRYGEFARWVPEEADYGCQIPDDWPS